MSRVQLCCLCLTGLPAGVSRRINLPCILQPRTALKSFQSIHFVISCVCLHDRLTRRANCQSVWEICVWRKDCKLAVTAPSHPLMISPCLSAGDRVAICCLSQHRDDRSGILVSRKLLLQSCVGAVAGRLNPPMLWWLSFAFTYWDFKQFQILNYGKYVHVRCRKKYCFMLENSRVRGAEEKQALNIFIGDMAFCQCDSFLVSFNQKKRQNMIIFSSAAFYFW